MSAQISAARQYPAIEQLLRARMAEGPFTFNQLQRIIVEHDGNWRLADRLIQKRRRAGEIAYERNGNSFVWHEVKP